MNGKIREKCNWDNVKNIKSLPRGVHERYPGR